MKICSHDGCERPVRCRGLCSLHESRARKSGELQNLPQMTPLERLRSRVVVSETGCHEYTWRLHSQGYSFIWAEGKRAFGHRIAYEAAYGPIPDGLFVLHRCDNRKCVNPEHLYAGTHEQNMQDKYDRGRTPAGDRHWNTKVPLDVANEIRDRYLAGGVTQEALAREYGLNQATVWGYVHGKRVA